MKNTYQQRDEKLRQYFDKNKDRPTKSQFMHRARWRCGQWCGEVDCYNCNMDLKCMGEPSDEEVAYNYPDLPTENTSEKCNPCPNVACPYSKEMSRCPSIHDEFFKLRPKRIVENQLKRKFTDNEAKGFMMKYLDENEQYFTILESIQYIETVSGRRETCGGCTLGDGRDCWPPEHFKDKFSVVCKKKRKWWKKATESKRYDLFMEWSDGDKDCSNSYGNYHEVVTVNSNEGKTN